MRTQIRTFSEARAGPGAAAAAAMLAAADPDGVTSRGGNAAGGSLGMPRQSPEVLLERLGFERKRQFQKVESLSGGERRRLHLAAVSHGLAGVLLLPAAACPVS